MSGAREDRRPLSAKADTSTLEPLHTDLPKPLSEIGEATGLLVLVQTTALALSVISLDARRVR